MLNLLLSGLLALSPIQDAGADSQSDSAVELPDWLPAAERGEALFLHESIVQSNHTIQAHKEAIDDLNRNIAAKKGDGDALKQELTQHQASLTEEKAQLKEFDQRLTQLTSLLHWPNPVLWLKAHGPSILGILAILFVGLRLISVMARQVLSRASKSTHGDAAERQQRAETLVSVFQKTAAVFLWGFCILALLGELGVNTTTLVAGLGLLGLAVSFGSQGLVKDFISGFFMLLENQIAIGDVISLNGNITGTVESFGMRVTVVRDSTGALHFVPNGSISRVSNLTHGYSKAVLTIGAGYREDPDQVIEVINSVLNEVKDDEAWAGDLLEDPSVLGVDALGESEVTFKISAKVLPGRQWALRRELLKRLKIAFDLADIEIPFPQRVHYTSGEQPSPRTLARQEEKN